MKHKTKKQISRHILNKTRKQKKSKRIYASDDEIAKVCSTGQYNTYDGNFYNNPKNIEKFNLIREKFKKNPKFKHLKTHKQRYTQFLKENFKESNVSDNMQLIKDDYYTYINQEWFKANNINDKKKKNYYVQYDNFRIKQEDVYYKLIEYVKKFIKENPTSKKAIALNNVYKSLINDTKHTFNKHVDAVVKEIDTYAENKDMYGLLANVNKNETISFMSPIQWNLMEDEKDVTKYISHLNTGIIGLYDTGIYTIFDNDDNDTKRYKRMIKREYLKYIDNVFEACLGKTDAKKYKAHDIWDIETELILTGGCDEKIKSDPNFYNKLSSHEIESKYGFEWTTFAKKLGYTDVPKKVIIGDLNGFKCTVKLLKENWDSEKWKTYWLYIQFKQMIRFEESLRHIHFNFYEKIIQGQPVEMSKDIYPIFGLSLLFNTFLSEQYVENNYNALYVNYVKKLSDDLKTLFIKKIEKNDWLSSKTKETALKKLKKLTMTVGSPEHLRADPLFDYTANDPLGNIGLLLNWKHKEFIKLEGKPLVDIPEFDWNTFKIVGSQCYIVNAYYMPTKNSIYIPLGYLQTPFIDLNERGLEYNLVYIGYTIGHELSHSLDDLGSKFDEKGNLHDWWTPSDRKNFNKKIKNVIKQYETFAKRDGIIFDATMSVGEDLADISGMALIEAYLIDNQVINSETNKLKKINLAQMYMNLAVQARQQIYKNAIKAQLKTNPHPLEKYRTNCTLARLELFKTIYGIKKGDGMWWNNDTIW